MFPPRNPSKTLKFLPFLLVAALALAGCNNPGEENGGGDDCKNKKSSLASSNGKSSDKSEKDDKCDVPDGDDDDDDVTGDPKPYKFPTYPGRVCTVDKFRQAGDNEPVVKKLDMLFVMDHSGSMQDDWERVANNVQNLVKELPESLDIRYAVLLANGSTYKGRLYAPAKTPIIQNNKTMKINEISNNLHKIFTEGMKVGDTNASGEASFLSLHSATTEFAKDNQNLGFFRADAALSILFMSDEQEIGFPFPNPQAPGLPPRCDAASEDNVKRNMYDSKGINLDVAFNAVKKMKGDMPVVTHAFVNITKDDLFKRNSKSASCLYDSLGYGYFEMVAKTKGVLFSIQENKAEGMARCGQVIKERLQLQHDFPLSKPANKVDAATILAAVDGAKVTHEYKSDTNIVHLADAGVEKSVIEIQHCEPIVRPSWTLQGFTGQADQRAASLTYQTPEYATYGRVKYGTSATALTSEVIDAASKVTDHVATITGLTPNTVYYFQATAVDEFGVTKQSSVISLRTKPDWSLTANAGQPSRNSVKISWKTTEYATRGRVKFGTDASVLSSETAESASAANQHDVLVEGLDANTNYFFQCVSRDEYGLEKKSEVFAVKTISDWGIVGFQGTAARTSMNLVWQTPDFDTQGKLLWGTSSGSLSNQANSSTGSPRSHGVVLNGLSPNTTYYFQAVNQDSLGAERRSVVIALKTLVDWNITGFAGTPTETSVSVSWTTPEYATTGKVLFGSTAENLNQQLAAGTSTGHAATINGLTEDTIYYFQAVSTDEFGLTKSSGVVAIRTLPKHVDPPVLPVWEITDFSGNADKNSVALSWKTTDYATTGTILYGTSDTNLSGQVHETAAFKDHALMVTGLTADTIYYFQAVSLDDQGQEKKSAVVAIRTLPEDPVEPPPVSDWIVKSFDATTTPTSADVIWQTPGAPTKATIKVGLTPDNLTLMSVDESTYAETHLVPVTGLSPNTTYYLQVIAVDKAGRTQESVVIMKKTKVQ